MNDPPKLSCCTTFSGKILSPDWCPTLLCLSSKFTQNRDSSGKSTAPLSFSVHLTAGLLALRPTSWSHLLTVSGNSHPCYLLNVILQADCRHAKSSISLDLVLWPVVCLRHAFNSHYQSFWICFRLWKRNFEMSPVHLQLHVESCFLAAFQWPCWGQHPTVSLNAFCFLTSSEGHHCLTLWQVNCYLKTNSHVRRQKPWRMKFLQWKHWLITDLHVMHELWKEKTHFGFQTTLMKHFDPHQMTTVVKMWKIGPKMWSTPI